MGIKALFLLICACACCTWGPAAGILHALLMRWIIIWLHRCCSGVNGALAVRLAWGYALSYVCLTWDPLLRNDMLSPMDPLLPYSTLGNKCALPPKKVPGQSSGGRVDLARADSFKASTAFLLHSFAQSCFHG